MTGDDTGSGPDGEIDRLPPGPDGLPVLGNTHQYVKQPMGFFDELAEYGDVVRWARPFDVASSGL